MSKVFTPTNGMRTPDWSKLSPEIQEKLKKNLLEQMRIANRTPEEIQADAILAAQKISQARKEYLFKNPFMGFIICRFQMIWDDRVRTMGVTIRECVIQCFYAAPWVNSLTLEELMSVLEHEALHVLNHHMSRQASRQKDPWNVACDMAINALIKTKLPADGCFAPPELLGKSAEYIYDSFPKECNGTGEEGQPSNEEGENGQPGGEDGEGGEPWGDPRGGGENEGEGGTTGGQPGGTGEDGEDGNSGSGEGEGDDKGKNKDGKDGKDGKDNKDGKEGNEEGKDGKDKDGKDKNGKGKDGKDKDGKDKDGKDKDGKDKDGKDKDGKGTDGKGKDGKDGKSKSNGSNGSKGKTRDLNSIYNKYGEPMDNHDVWQGADHPGLAALVVKQLVQEAVAKNKGDIPGQYQALVEQILKTKVDWRSLLRYYVSSRIRANRKLSYKHRDRRRLLATKYVFPGHVRKEGLDIVVCCDTSGSMFCKSEMEQFFTELEAIIRQTSAQTRLLQIDADVQDDKMYKQGDWRNIKIKGGGGTDFRPAFKYIEKKKYNPCVVIFYTDGCGDYPAETEVPKYQVLWCMTTDVKAPFGKVIKLDMD